MKTKRKELLEDAIENVLLDESYGISDDFGTDKVKELLVELIGQLDKCRLADGKIGETLVHVNNGHSGFVSCSSDEITGVSRTLYKPYFEEDGLTDGLVNLLEMIDEAYYYSLN